MKTFDINNIQLKIQSPDEHFDPAMEEYCVTQVEKLGVIMPRITGCEVMLTREKESHKKNSIAEIKLFVPGAVLFSKEQDENYRLAAKHAFDDVRDQLLKLKGKREDKSVDLSGAE